MYHMKTRRAAAAVTAFIASFASAQEKANEKRDVMFQVERFEVAAPPPGAGLGQTFEFISADMGGPGKLVKGAPYQAEAANESVQMLPDGNRITNKTTSAVARDTDGRTRREQSLPAIGPWASQGDAAKMIFINDPVANIHYVLDERMKTARKMPTGERMRMPVAGAVAAAGAVGVAGAAEQGNVVTFVQRNAVDAPKREPKVEQLGQKNIEGIVAEGTKLTMTIPAGEVGNERPLEVVTERWYSPELQTVVMSKHSDPRFGESTYKLTHISRTEPSRSLFEVPSDYQVMDMNSREPVEIRMKKQ